MVSIDGSGIEAADLVGGVKRREFERFLREKIVLSFTDYIRRQI